MAEGKSLSVKDATVFKMKIAVALACLRTKPSDMTAQEYAKQLSNKFKTIQFRLQQKLKKTEVEMLHLQQELALYKQNQHIAVSTESSMTCSQSQPLFQTPPPSGNPNLNQSVTAETTNSTRSSLSKHTTFLHQTIVLQTGSKIMCDKTIENIVHKSLLHSLDLIKDLYNDCDYIWKLQSQCIECLCAVLKEISPHLRSDLISKTKEIAEELIKRLALEQHLSTKVRRQQARLLQQLGTDSFLCCELVEQLCGVISKFSDHLRGTLSDSVELDPYYFSNIYLVLDTLDACLSGQSITTALGTEQRKQFVQQLEDCTMYLSESFPLFTFAIWRLCCKLSA